MPDAAVDPDDPVRVLLCNPRPYDGISCGGPHQTLPQHGRKELTAMLMMTVVVTRKEIKSGFHLDWLMVIATMTTVLFRGHCYEESV